jgi:hypothetical protein
MSTWGLMVARVVWAALLLGCPGVALRAMGGSDPGGRWRLVARVLGARHLAEALLERGGRPDRVRLAAVVDTAHAASVIGFAILDRSRRRVALADASVAGSFAAYGWWLAGRRAS